MECETAGGERQVCWHVSDCPGTVLPCPHVFGFQFQGIAGTAAGAGTQAGGAQSAQRSTGNTWANGKDT